jgi:catechol 2,3-dioxygenase-like lactoylglutathione lyase family enzyme
MRIAVQAPGALTNTADNFARVDERAPVYPKAEPVRIGHAVFFAPDVNAVRDFYQERLGFVLSDAYPDAGYFLRAGEEGAHHDLFVLSTPDGKRGLNHISFVVRDIHEVFGGGMAMDRAGWGTQIGPGRHPVSSAYFWYLHCPAGAVVEYFADEDHCTVAWQARDWVRSPENYAEWAVSGGIDGHSRRLART